MKRFTASKNPYIKVYGHKVQILLQMEGKKKKKKVSLTHKIDDRSFHKKLKNILFIVGLTEEKKNYCKKKNSR